MTTDADAAEPRSQMADRFGRFANAAFRTVSTDAASRLIA